MNKDLDKIWNSCLNSIRKNIDPQPFKTWFEPIKPIKLDSNVLTIQVPNKFFYEWLEEHYATQLHRAIKSEIGAEGRLEYQIMVENHRKIGNNPNFTKPAVSEVTLTKDTFMNPFVIPGIKKQKIESQLNKNYTYDKLVIGECNKFPTSAGLAIAKKPGGTAFNPLVIYGDTGLGKTHLVQAIGNEILSSDATKNVLYVSVDNFTNQVIQAIKSQSVNDFMQFYQFIDVLIVDDIHFLSSRSKTQEIFFNIFNHLHQSGKQIILTSDRSPKDLSDVDTRLISRFKWGLVAELKVPDLETRKKILESKLSKEGIELSSDLKDYICSNIKNNIRELEGVVISIVAQSTLNRKPIDLKLVKDVVRQFVSQVDKEISIESIKQLVAKFMEIPVEKIQSKTRLREVVMARQLSMYLAKNYTNSSLKNIGESFGGRDHSTVIHSLKTVQDMIDTDLVFKDKVSALVKKVQSSLLNE